MSARSSFTVEPGGPLRGRLRMPGDKSISHRALLVAARADGTSTVRGLSTGDDVLRTAAAVVAMGAVIEGDSIHGGLARLGEPDHVIDVGNSGTGIRLLAGFAAALPWLTVLQGDESIARRPMDRVVEPLRAMGATIDGRHGGRLAPLVIRGGDLHGIDYTPPVASAQVKGAVLLAGAGASSATVVREAHPTRMHTEEVLARAGAAITVDPVARTSQVEPGPLAPFSLDVPGDPSQAAFWVVAASIVPGSDLTIENVYVGPARAGFIDVLRRMGASIDVVVADGAATTADIRVRAAPLHGTEVAGAEIPGLDEIPVLAVAAACAEGITVFHDVAELRVKESDRIATTTAELAALGVRIEGGPDRITVHGGDVRGGHVQSHGDHRIAMSMAVAALVASEPTVIEGWDAVSTSYPGFEEDLQSCR